MSGSVPAPKEAGPSKAEGWLTSSFDLFENAQEFLSPDVRGRVTIKIKELEEEYAKGTSPRELASKIQQRKVGHIPSRSTVMRWERLVKKLGRTVRRVPNGKRKK